MRLRVELCCKFLARASGARAIGAAGLGHEAVDHAVEHDAVIEALACQLLDARDMIGRAVGAHLDDDAALRRIHRSEEHTSELQSRENLVCRHLPEKK